MTLTLTLTLTCSDPTVVVVVQSPADRTQRIHAGDEVIGVNQQTVVSPTAPPRFLLHLQTFSLFIDAIICPLIGTGRLAAEASGGQVKGGDRKCSPGGEEETVRHHRQFCSCSTEEHALEVPTGAGRWF